MKIKYDYLYAVEYSKPDLMDESGYKYVIPGLYTAYRTDKGYNKINIFWTNNNRWATDILEKRRNKKRYEAFYRIK